MDLLTAAPAALREVSVNAQEAQQTRALIGRLRRIRDAEHATLPATPPSRLRFVVDVPNGGRLAVAAGIAGRYHTSTAVEFVVKVRQHGQPTTVLSRLLDPANRPADRAWVPLEADLSKHAGRGIEILFETHGFDRTDRPDRAFWGTPTITTAAAGRAPLAIVYLVDTLRADHLRLYGYERDTSRELDRFARDAVVFEQAVAASSWTKPSVASLFTSLLPSRHHCVQFFTPLDPSLITLAEMLRDRGYGTGAVVANNLLLTKDAYFDQGFTYFAAPPLPQRAGQAVDAALAFLRARRGLPTFLYVHTMDPHSPYAPPAPFDRRFPPSPIPGRPAAEPYDYREPLDRDRIVAQYDGEVAYGDQEFGRLIRELKARGLYEDSLIVFVSDHGEEFLEHGDWMHGGTLFDELVRVPLVVKYPGNRYAGRRIERQVQLIDVLPTVLKSQNVPVPLTPEVAGRPLEESFGASGEERPALSETKYREGVAYGARTRTAKYVWQLDPKPREMFFDLAGDPREKTNQLPEAATRAQALKRMAEADLAPSVFRHHLRVTGQSDYELRIRTSGWIENVEAVGLGPTERATMDGAKHNLSLTLKPRPGRPREISVLTKPHGAPLWIEGTRGGHPLRQSDIRLGADGVHAAGLPPRFPEVEDVDGLFSQPRIRRAEGIAMWLTLTPRGWPPPRFDSAAREQLRALGYIR